MKVDAVIIDYGMGNLRSVEKAIRHVAPEKNVLISREIDVIRSARRVIVPGQGAMPDCMQQLKHNGLAEVIIQAARSRPFLGICVGLQLLLAHSEEGEVDSLGIFAGQVRRFSSTQASNGERLKVPHMGWNRVQQIQTHALWQGIPDLAYFYFVHSYYAAPTDSTVIAGVTNHGQKFASVCAKDNIFAVQFHPEKSAQQGLCLLKNFMAWEP